MIKLELVSVGTETVKVVKKEFGFPVSVITPIIKEKTKKTKKTKKGSDQPTSYLSSGSLWLNEEAMTVLNLSEGSKVTISEAKTGLIIYNSTSVDVEKQFKKMLTKTNVLRISADNFNRIYSANALDKFDSWVFKLEEVLIDLPWEENAKVYFFTPLEKSA